MQVFNQQNLTICTLGVLAVQADVATNPQIIIFEK